MAEPWREAVELLREYSDHKGYEWPGYSASHLQHTIMTSEGRWTNWSSMPAVDTVLSQSRFDVDDLAKDYLGIKIIIEDLSNLDRYADSPVFGFARPGTWSISICPRAKRYMPLYRATVMHEVGHLFLHSVEHARMLAFTPFAIERPPAEREADQFMSVSLLPRSVLWLAIARFAESAGIDLRELLIGANGIRGQWQWQHRMLRPLVDTLAVSRQMICIKLKQMHVFNTDTVNHHLSYAMDTKWTQPEFAQPLRTTIQRLIKKWT